MTAVSLGIDLATTNGSTGVCEIHWGAGKATVTVGSPSNDELRAHILDVTAAGGWVAIDAPFGFPRAFSRAVAQWHQTGRVDPATDDDIRRRVTDRHVYKRQLAVPKDIRGRGQIWPLSSVVERITPTTVRTMQLLSSLTKDGVADRIGRRNHVFEAYPITAFRLWHVRTGKYKAGVADADMLMKNICAQVGIDIPNLTLVKDKCKNDAVDAVGRALVARLAALEPRTAPDPAEFGDDMALILDEGWIHLPPDGHRLADLRGAVPVSME